MAPRRENQESGRIDRGTANDVIGENLGIDLNELAGEDLSDDGDGDDELGSDQPDLGSQGDDGDDGGDDGFESDPNDPFDPSLGQEPPERVSHTRDRREQQEPPKRPLPRRSEVKADKNGNLIGKDGKIVARAGREARLYQSRERARKDLSRAQTETTQVREQLRRLAGAARTLHTELETRKAADNRLKEFGISPQEQLTALQMFTELRDNPQAGIRRILARAAAQGVDLTQMGQNGNVGLDAKAIADLVRGEVGKVVEPLKARSDEQKQREEQEENRRKQEEEAAVEVRQFFQRNPEAVPYAPVFTKVLNNPAYAHLSLGEIYARILQHPNLTRQQSRQRSRTPNNGMPRGRGTAPSGNSRIADPGSSYEAILDTVLTEAGMPRQQRV